MAGYLLLAIIVILGIILSGIATIFLLIWLIKLIKNRRYKFAIPALLVFIPLFSWYFYKHTNYSVINDFEKVAEVKVPKNYKKVDEENSFMLVIAQMAHINLELDRVSTNKLILDIQKTKNYLPIYYLQHYNEAIAEGKIKTKNNWTQSGKGYYLFSAENKNGRFLVGLDSNKKTLSIQKNWSIFD